MINLPQNLKAHEYNLYISAFEYCQQLTKDATLKIGTAVDKTVEKYSKLLENSETLRNFLLSEITSYTEPSIGVIAEEIEDRTWWNDWLKNEGNVPYFWWRYYNYLNTKPAWSLQAIQSIETSTNEIMNVLANPQSKQPNDRMGLVFGYVQSGKTAHYIGLINKAYDAGYKVVIVLTGIHNSLRSQTQSRIDEEVLGYETSLENIVDFTRERNAIGVGLSKVGKTPFTVQSITTRDDKGDVNTKTGSVSMVPPFIIVTKKNATVLKKLINFFKKNPLATVGEDGKKKIPVDYPALIIDDEADQASINTNACYDENDETKEYRPTKINALIRDLLNVFECRSYVGYTATPFANIFISPKNISDKPGNDLGNDLFPRDFIFRAPRSSQYIGAREFFGIGDDENTPAMPLYRKIEKGVSFLGKGTKANDPVGELPEELKHAIKCFLISTAMRNCRGQINSPNTMLIHIVRFIQQQQIIKRKVEDFFSEVANLIQYGDKEIQEELKVIWKNDYLPTTEALRKNFASLVNGCTDVAWNYVWQEIKRLVTRNEIVIYCVNGKSEDVLIYKNHKGKPFNVIVIGGDKLSRGLTLEGLTISYFTRGSNTYDTLMQMGRWFGFRPGYLDVCRLFTTPNLNSFFAHISMATEELAEQFDLMNNVVKTPLEFGLRVISHPLLEITSRNKLRTGTSVMCDFSCTLSQTRAFDIDVYQFDNNFAAVEDLLKEIASYKISKDKYKKTHEGRTAPANHYFWQNVPAHFIIEFFKNYQTSTSASRVSSQNIATYISTLNANGIGGVKDWTVCLINVGAESETFNIAGLKVGAGINRERNVIEGGDVCSIRTMTSTGHEYYDYTQSQLDFIEVVHKECPKALKGDSLNETIRQKTRPFEKGLLLLYPIAKAGKLTEAKGTHKTPFGFAVVFPDRQGQGNLHSYRLNEIAMENRYNEFDE